MNVAEDIRRLGFRRWYERQLVVSHAYLVAAFLALIALLSGIEAMGYLRRSAGFYVAVAVGAAVAGTLVFIAWRRFSVLLARAELFAEKAECPRCQAWGKFLVIAAESSAADDPPEAGRPRWIRVRCRVCGNDWKLG
ncbi:MAG: hypothetical protein AB1761_14310 [Pseudomonadota bacterium]